MPLKSEKPSQTEVSQHPALHLTDWNLLRSFVAIYDTGTLTAAAKRLGITQPSLGRHLRELELLVRETLFTRLPGKLKPTERADALFAATYEMHHAVRNAELLFSSNRERLSGVVRVAVAEAYGYHVVPQLLGTLMNEQPELEIELSVSNRSDNLLRRDADIAMRFFRPNQDDLIAVKLGDAEMGLFAHDDYIARFGEPTDFALPEGGFVTGFDRQDMPLAPSLRGRAPSELPRFRFRTDSAMARQAAIASGAGMGMLFVDIAQTIPGLRRVLADKVSLAQEVWLCAHDELRRSSRMRFVWDRLEAELKMRFSAI